MLSAQFGALHDAVPPMFIRKHPARLHELAGCLSSVIRESILGTAKNEQHKNAFATAGVTASTIINVKKISGEKVCPCLTHTGKTRADTLELNTQQENSLEHEL